MKTLPIILLPLFICLGAAAQQPVETHGKAMRMLRNGHDILHPRNEEDRHRLMQDAVIDAIERVAPVEVQMEVRHAVQEERGGSSASFNERYEFTTQQRTRMAWARTGDFQFERDRARPRLWTCTVKGTVREVKEQRPLETPGPGLARGGAHVARKRGAALTVRMTTEQRLRPGDRVELLGGPGAVVRGQAIVIDTAEGLAHGRLVSGIWTARVHDRVRPGDFPLLRGGIRFRHGITHSVAYAEDMPHTTIPHVTRLYSFDLYEQGLVDHWGFLFGLDVLDDDFKDVGRAVSLIPRVGVEKGFAIVPGTLFLTPGFAVGLAIPGVSEDMDNPVLQLHLQPSVELVLRLGSMDLSAGMINRMTMGNVWLSGAMPTMGLRFDLYRSSPSDANQRSKPSLGGAMAPFVNAAVDVHGWIHGVP